MLTVDNVLDELVSINFGGDLITVRQYILRVGLGAFEESESFNAYRAFGNSDWEYEDICEPLGEKFGVDCSVVRDLILAALRCESGLGESVEGSVYVSDESLRGLVAGRFGDSGVVGYEKFLKRHDKFVLGQVLKFIAFDPGVSVSEIEAFVDSLVSGESVGGSGVALCGDGGN